MGQTGGFEQRPGGGSLVSHAAESGPAPGKQTLVQQQEAAGTGAGAASGAARKDEAKIKQHAGGGFSKYGGPSVREQLTRMVEQGQLQISGKQIALLDAVAQVETGGKIGCVQTYDDQIVSVGFKQVVLGHGSLEKIMNKAPAGFARHGLALDTSKKYSHPGWSNHPSQIAGCEDEDELRKPEWGLKFYEASMEPDVVAAMVELALGEAGKVEKAVAKHGGGADLFSDPTAQGWLLETYNNRPAFMPIAIKKAVAGGAKEAASRDAFLDILAKAIVDTYVEQEPLLHYRKAKKRKGKLTAEQDAALLEESRQKYEAVGRRKGGNITTKIKRNLVIPKLDGDKAQPPAPAPGGSADAAPAPAPAPVATPADEVLMSMPAPEPELMSIAPEEELVCLPGDPIEGAPAGGDAQSTAAPASTPEAGPTPAPAPTPTPEGAPEAAEREPAWSVRARAYNREHTALAEQFLRATDHACVGADGELDPAEVARWQVAHGLAPDGRIGPQTVKAAKAARPASPEVAPEGPEVAPEGPSQAPRQAPEETATAGPAPAGPAGGGGASGGHDELPVPTHGDDMNAPEKVETKPTVPARSPSAPAKPAGKEIYKQGGILSKEHLGRYDLDDQEYAFKLRVYDAAVARLGDKIYGGVPREELVGIENGKQIRRDVSGPLDAMLSAMRADLKAGKPAGDKEIGKATGIAVTSAYRSPETDRDLWDSYFQKYLAKTTADREATGDPFGAEALKILVRYIASRKAPPGGSNHSNGTAVDLSIEEGGVRLKNSYDNQSAWRKSWHYAWLNANAASYGFKNYPKEAWHWDYKG